MTIRHRAQPFILATLVGIGLTLSREATADDLPPVLTPEGNVAPDGIVSLERVTLGGVEQTILIRGASTDLPVLLFLHGGPGGAIMPWVDLFHTPLLEESFVVVHWDQRGAGSSYDPDLTVDDLTPRHFISDTLELTDILCERFEQEHIFLTGQSWGSALGFMTIARNSTPFHAFIAVSERVVWDRSFEMGYEWALEQARAGGDADILAQLEAIAPFDAFDEADLSVQRQAVAHYFGGDYHTPGLEEQYLSYALGGQSPYYTMADVQSYIPGLEISSDAVEQAEFLATYDLFELLPATDIPVHFITGADDWNTPADLAFAYYQALDAPDKSFHRIPDAAHMVLHDQPDAWADAMVGIRNVTLGWDQR
ncbi:alpha/beta fold hydrolase [Pacificoceanicola onchidii]|uniref:alpha/beta fold hydrolase n=1 Tax=Pacificoceanicola onchidii TaxID=2562685 RepID=UPI0010A644E9|nr:alpha/beta hydrolase [Pacificoceanicola onchidii]